MRERTLENAQLHLLATRYDFSMRSRLGRAIIREVNTVLDEEERRRGITRIRTGELLLRTYRGYLKLPLRTEKDMDRLIAGERWDVVRRDIMARCEEQNRELFPDADASDVAGSSAASFRGVLHDARGEARKQRPWNGRARKYRPRSNGTSALFAPFAVSSQQLLGCQFAPSGIIEHVTEELRSIRYLPEGQHTRAICALPSHPVYTRHLQQRGVKINPPYGR